MAYTCGSVSMSMPDTSTPSTPVDRDGDMFDVILGHGGIEFAREAANDTLLAERVHQGVVDVTH